jgi:hypothetical protein
VRIFSQSWASVFGVARMSPPTLNGSNSGLLYYASSYIIHGDETLGKTIVSCLARERHLSLGSLPVEYERRAPTQDLAQLTKVSPIIPSSRSSNTLKI